MILGILIKAEYHWGYWIRTPFTSKIQTTIPIPPPTTIIGALTNYLAREGLLKDPNGGRVSGEIFRAIVEVQKRGRKIDLRSPASLLDGALIAASAALCEGRKAFIIDDINKYITLLFQEKIPEEVHGEKIPRRYLPKYRAGAISCGKVYYPSGLIDIACIFDISKLERVVDDDPVRALVESAWNINRLGSKESLATVRDVSYVELDKSKIDKGRIKTRFYFPSRAGMVVHGDYYTETFWRRGWGRYDPPTFEEYIIPGSRNPVTSSEVTVDAETYVKLDENVIMVFPMFGG